MGTTLSMLKNKIYLFDRWLSSGENIFYLLSLTIIAVAMINFETTFFYGIGLFSLICIYTLIVKIKIRTKEWNLDKSIYTLPNIGEVLIVQKDFRYDLVKVENSRSYIHRKMLQDFSKEFEFEVTNIKELDDNWIIELRFLHKSSQDLLVELFWLDVYKYFMTKSQVREDKLNKLLK
jgi:hypothetical protein